MAVTANERENGPPISFAKFRQGLARLVGIASRVDAGQHDTPLRGGEAISAGALLGACLGNHSRAASYLRNFYASKKAGSAHDSRVRCCSGPR